MQEQWKKPITYARFWDRLERWWQLKIAIETPNTKLCNTESSLETNQRREFVIKTAYKDSIQIQPLDDLLKMNRIKMPKPKPTLWQRIKKLLKID